MIGKSRLFLNRTKTRDTVNVQGTTIVLRLVLEGLTSKNESFGGKAFNFVTTLLI